MGRQVDSETAGVNDILTSYGKPPLEGSVAQNVAAMNGDPEGYRKYVKHRQACSHCNKTTR